MDLKKIELLAPAGSFDMAMAAADAGADAIYLGLTSFSARSAAENFDMPAFEKILSYCKAFDVKVYVALNTIVKDFELKNFLSLCLRALCMGADALILQDVFLGRYIKDKCPNAHLHLSTQAGVCNEFGALYAKDMGFDRVILSRETALKDMEKISHTIETEAFVQGALCTCFSGQCYLSSFAGGNSGNRGRCKQPCRKRYFLDRKGYEDLSYKLSLSDLCVGENIQAYIDAGVGSFKIEGRLRSPEYVAAAVRYYKDILNGKTHSLQKDKSALARTYNRGDYTKGLAFGQDKSFISSDIQGHIGEKIGYVDIVS